MECIPLTDDTRFAVLLQAERMLKAGGVLAAPSDTVYGLFADATSEHAIERIFSIKGRAHTKALPIYVRDIAMARHYAYISDEKAQFLERVWPGAVTVIFHHKERLPGVLTAGGDTIGIRIPDHRFWNDLLSHPRMPIAQTSANTSGRPAAKNITELEKYIEMWKVEPDLLIDGGEIEGTASTVIDFTGVLPMVRRTGAMTKEKFNALLSSLG